MVLFFKQNKDLFGPDNLILENSFGKDKVLYSDKITGKEEVILASDPDECKEALRQRPTARVILMTNEPWNFSPTELIKFGNEGISTTVGTDDISEVVKTISSALKEKKNLNFYVEQEKAPHVSLTPGDTRLQLPGIVNNHISGSSEPIKNVLHRLSIFARNKNNILITGEQGVGKGNFINALVDNTGIAPSAVRLINMGAINEELFKSTLFGYRKGAFTGADKDSLGYADVCKDGLIIFDEVGNATKSMQQALHTFIQDREYTPVGSTEKRQFQGRFVFCTNKDLQRECLQDKFMPDLYDRIAVLTLKIPPLRERQEDIPLLVQDLLQKENARQGTSKSMTADAVQYLSEQPWSGNVRHLDNFIKRYVAFTMGSAIGLSDIMQVNQEGTHHLLDDRAIDESRREAARLRERAVPGTEALKEKFGVAKGREYELTQVNISEEVRKNQSLNM